MLKKLPLKGIWIGDNYYKAKTKAGCALCSDCDIPRHKCIELSKPCTQNGFLQSYFVLTH